jgi:site-specific recombinase XerD
MEFEQFLVHWRSMRRCSPATIRAYRNDLKLFEQFLDSIGIHRLNQVTHTVITQYIEHLEQKPSARFGRRGLADVTIARRLASLSSYFELVRVSGDLKLRNPLKDLPRRWHKEHSYKAVDDVVIDQLLSGITNLRDRLMFSLFLASGLRVSEGINLTATLLSSNKRPIPRAMNISEVQARWWGKAGNAASSSLMNPRLSCLQNTWKRGKIHILLSSCQNGSSVFRSERSNTRSRPGARGWGCAISTSMP